MAELKLILGGKSFPNHIPFKADPLLIELGQRFLDRYYGTPEKRDQMQKFLESRGGHPLIHPPDK